MALTKAKIFNLALGALLLQRRIIDTATDQSNECNVLNTHWEMALDTALEDMDLDSTSTTGTLALIEEDPNDDWNFAYGYPLDCVLFRRIRSLAGSAPDNVSSHIPKLIQLHDGQKVIFTDEVEAIGEWITNDVPITSLSSLAGMVIAYKLASLSCPLIVGKGASKLRQEIDAKYVIYKAEALEHDRRENHNFNEAVVDSEFVAARTE